MRDWFSYVRAGYDLIVEAEGKTSTYLDHEVEAYIVHMFARNLERTDIGEAPVAIQLMEAMQSKDQKQLLTVADECLIINSYPMRRKRWPSATYYIDMGTIGYGFAGNTLLAESTVFCTASKVLNVLFQQRLTS